MTASQQGPIQCNCDVTRGEDTRGREQEHKLCPTGKLRRNDPLSGRLLVRDLLLCPERLRQYYNMCCGEESPLHQTLCPKSSARLLCVFYFKTIGNLQKWPE